MSKTNPFDGVKAGWLSLESVVSEISADGSLRRLMWELCADG